MLKFGMNSFSIPYLRNNLSNEHDPISSFNPIPLILRRLFDLFLVAQDGSVRPAEERWK